MCDNTELNCCIDISQAWMRNWCVCKHHELCRDRSCTLSQKYVFECPASPGLREDYQIVLLNLLYKDKIDFFRCSLLNLASHTVGSRTGPWVVLCMKTDGIGSNWKEALLIP